MCKYSNINSFFKRHPSLLRISCAYIIGILFCTISVIKSFPLTESLPQIIGEVLITSLFVGVLLGYPLVITIKQIREFIASIQNQAKKTGSLLFDIWTLLLGVIYEAAYLTIEKEVVFTADWQVQLYNGEMHSPINTEYTFSFILIAILALAAFFSLRIKSVNALPPLVSVGCISALYAGLIVRGIWTIQVINYKDPADFFLLLPTATTFLIAAKTIALKIMEFAPDQSRMDKISQHPFLNGLHRLLKNAKTWPFLSLLFLLPFLAFIVLILILFGQSPDALIKAFTQTSQWNLSQKVSPQNIYYDEHYLCTVAAGGHPQIVKPLRLGIRHGHTVIVNRQLLVANAFEELIQEKIPHAHRVIRRIYDDYGFPLAKHIRSKWVADLIWFLMKPAEWLFLATLYLFDIHPEDRIARQYSQK